MAIGLQDFIGTGWYASEYIAATKHLNPNFKITGGLGWGRLGSLNGFSNPLSSIFGSGWGSRTVGTGLGGVPKLGNWFHGPAAFFGGIEWQTPVRGLTFKAEYSSDTYTTETISKSFFTRRSPFNFGLTYRFKNNNEISAYYLYGDQIGISGSMVINPHNPPNKNSIGPAPLPVLARPNDDPRNTGWTQQANGAQILNANLATLLAQDGQKLEAFSITASSVEVRFRNLTHEAVPQAIGRVARILTNILPASTETFVIIPVINGIPIAAYHMQRSDVEALEHDPDGAKKMLARTKIRDAGPLPENASYAEEQYPRFSWEIEPYTAHSLFDPDNPIRVDFGLRAAASYEARPGLIFSGAVRKRVIGNLNTVTRLSNSVLQHVRSDYGLYDNAGDPAIEHLTAEYFFRPGKNLYGRVTAGYLEKMYAGASAEILWKPVDSNFALGVEINFAKQRAYDQLFGLLTYQAVTGHVSAYWDMGNGFNSQIDAGRYLAGDYGATFTLNRVFDNGWRVGAFFTLTNVSFATFGEGSFDKGISITIPISWMTGKATRDKGEFLISPITRDGGAKLNVRNRLHDLVSDYQSDRLKRRWGRFWR